MELTSSVATQQYPEIAAPPGDIPLLESQPLYPAALQKVLESNDYQVALVPRREWDCIRRSEYRQPEMGGSRVPPTVLLAFSWKELVARICEFAGDTKTSAQSRVAQFSDVYVDFSKMEVSRSSGEVITLGSQEFKTLKCFLSNPGRVFSRGELLNEAWGYTNYPSTRTVDNHVLKLRQKLERDPAHPVHFRTVHRVGYKFLP
jgi:DNA-binding winged helix-turn-helix (wHTH) protein